jgi:hypothetical protein
MVIVFFDPVMASILFLSSREPAQQESLSPAAMRRTAASVSFRESPSDAEAVS